MNPTQYFRGIFDPSAELGTPEPGETLRPFVYPDGHQGWLISGHALARQVLADPRFSARAESKRAPVHRPSAEAFYGRPTPPGWFIDMDAPEHTRFRRLLAGHFTARRMTRLRSRVERVTADCLHELGEASRPADLVDLFTLPVPLQSICELLGVPYSQREVLRRDSETLFSLEASASAGASAMDELTGLFLDLIRHKRAHPGDDLISDLAGGDLTDDELAGVGVLLLTAGHETVASMLGLGVLAVLSAPEHLPAFLGPQEAVAVATEELLRYLSILHFGVPRCAVDDVELDGRLVSAGAAVTVSLPAANRDPARYVDPDALDLTRDATAHLAFGHGAHQCVGQNLARLEMRVAYPALFHGLAGLRLAEPADRIPLTRHGAVYGVARLPVTWD